MTFYRAPLKAHTTQSPFDVTRLQKLGMLTEITGRSWGRLHLARPILRIIETAEGKRAQSGDKEKR